MLVADLEEAMKIDAGISGKRTSSVKARKLSFEGGVWNEKKAV